MVPARCSFRRSRTFRHRFTLALASAEDRLAEAHAEAAMAFLRETRWSLSTERALEIYFRLVAVPGRIRRSATVRALARIDRMAPPDAEGAEEREGPVTRLLRRLRGRRADVLRARVRRATELAQRKVRRAYLEGAATVVGAVQGLASPAEAVQMYLDALDVHPIWAARIFHEAVAGAAGAGG